MPPHATLPSLAFMGLYDLINVWIGLDYMQAYFGIRGPLGARLFNLVTQNRNDQKLTFEDLVIAKVRSCSVLDELFLKQFFT